MTPEFVTGTISAAGQAARTESCSMADTKIRARPLPSSARPFASVAPLVKMMAGAVAPITSAMDSRASSIARCLFCRRRRADRRFGLGFGCRMDLADMGMTMAQHSAIADIGERDGVQE